MALESFYGGKQGISPVVKATFSSKENLKEAFENSDYKDVWFSELALIDTPNKLNRDNGKLYRRTLKTTLSTTDENYAGEHAEYIGQIVGPAGGIPNLEIISEADIKEKLNNSTENDNILFPIGPGTSSINKEDSEDLFFNNLGDIELLSGKENDNIQYTWTNIQTPDGDNNTAYVYLGFKVPYPVFEFEPTTLNYTESVNIEENQASKNHPFYWKWNLSIPRGIRGIWQEIHIGNKTPWIFNENNPLYANITDLIYDEQSDTYSVNSLANKKQSTVEDYFWYITVKCPTQDGTITNYNFYLEPYISIKEIKYYDNTEQENVKDAGDIQLIFDDNTKVINIGHYQQIKNAEYNPEDGSIHLQYAGKRPNINPIEGSGQKNSGLDRYYLVDSADNPLYINYIEDVYGDTVKNEFYILYSSSKYRPDEVEAEDKIIYEDSKGRIWKKDADGGNSGKYWLYVSPLTKVQDGLRIAGKADVLQENYPDISNITTAIEILNDKEGAYWPEGNPYEDGQDGHGRALEGRFLSVEIAQEGEDDESSTEAYAVYYDQNINSWVSLGAWGTSGENSTLNIYIPTDTPEEEVKQNNQRAVGFIINTFSPETQISSPWNYSFNF